MGRTSKDKRDIYYRKAKALGYRARSIFKLEQIDQQCDLFTTANNIVDLCAAPGSWSQYISNRLKELNRLETSRVIAIDLQEMVEIEGVRILKADITEPSTLEAVREYFNQAAADIVLSDGAPDVLGMHDVDEYIQGQLVLAALEVAIALLRPGGTFVAKVFRQKETDILYTQLRALFSDVCVVKPRSCRNTSIEAFVLCRGFTPVEGFVPAIVPGDTSDGGLAESSWELHRAAVPFFSAGDASGLDADMSYSLDVDVGGLDIGDDEKSDDDEKSAQKSKYVSLPPVVPPIEPPYAEAIRRQKQRQHNTGPK